MAATDSPSGNATPIDRLDELLERALAGEPIDSLTDTLPPSLRAQLLRLLRSRAQLPGGEASVSASTAPERLGPFRLERCLGHGGQGSVWLATDERIGRRLAVKILRAAGAASPRQQRLFRREAAVAGRIDDPGICTVYEAGTCDGVAYLAMRYVAGRTLAQWIEAMRGGAAAPVDWLDCAETCARSLHVAHEAGVVHRDLKPGNVMLTDAGRPVILDFGLAQDEAGAASTLTRDGGALGTPAYMPPERIAPELGPADRRGDIWSLAATFHEVLTLQAPFAAPTREGLYREILTAEPRRLRLLRPDLPRDVATVFAVAMAKAMDQRYQTARDFADDLRRARERRPIVARPTPLAVRAARWFARHRWAAAGTGLALLAVLAGLAVALVALGDTDRALQQARVRLELTEAQVLADRDPAAALRTWVTRAGDAPRAVVNEAILPLLERAREQRVLPAHRGAITAIAWSGDGERVATAGRDGAVHIVSAADGTLLHDIRGEAPRTAMAFSGAGDRLLVGDDGGRVHVLDVATGRPIAGFAALPGTIRSLCRADGPEVLIVAGDDGRIREVDFGGRTLAEFAGMSGIVRHVTFLPDPGLVAAVGDAGIVCVWRSSLPQPIARLQQQDGVTLYDVTFVGPDRLLTASADNTAWVWDLRHQRLLRRFAGHDSAVLGVTFAPTTGLAATVAADRRVLLWDPADGRQHLQLAGHQQPPDLLAFAPDGQRLATAGADGSARLWWVGRQNGLAVLDCGADLPTNACFSPDGRLVVSLGNSDTVRIWDATTGAMSFALHPHSAPATGAAFASEHTLLTAASDGTLCLTELDAGAAAPGPPQRLEVPDFAAPARVNAVLDGRRARFLATTSRGQAWLGTIDPFALQHELQGLASFYSTGSVTRAAFNRDGTLVATVLPGAQQRLIAIWRTQDGALLRSYRDHTDLVESLAWSPIDDRLVSASVDRTVRVYDTSTTSAAAALVLTGHTNCVLQASFDAQARWIAAAGMDGTVRVWDAATGVLRQTLGDHDALVYAATFAPMGDRLVTASWDGTAIVYDAASGERLLRHARHDKAVLATCWRPDGRFVLSVSRDGTVRVWPADPLEFARHR